MTLAKIYQIRRAAAVAHRLGLPQMAKDTRRPVYSSAGVRFIQDAIDNLSGTPHNS